MADDDMILVQTCRSKDIKTFNKMPHISQINDEHAKKAACMTGLPFDTVLRTYWGIVVLSDSLPMSFCFHFKRESFECGIPGLLTPRPDKVIEYLKEAGYEFDNIEELTYGKPADNQ